MIAVCPASFVARAEVGVDRLNAYFRSGWAFLLPYLATYLAYAWLQGPVNPTDSLFRDYPSAPSLLHAFWVLHALNLALGAVALVSWWRRNATSASFRENALSTVVPWLLLALLFFIPRVYLEFPGDPWEHYARIVDWKSRLLVTSAPTWTKSSYFLAYSLFGWTGLPLRSHGFHFYYTGCCLLLSWQYFRLAQSAGMDRRLALLFVILQVLLFGNGPFGFFRYYGMSSTLFAQLGAIALIRLALEHTMPRASAHARVSISGRIACALPAVCGLVALIALNHVQGLGIAALGVGACLLHALCRQGGAARNLTLGTLVATNTGIVLYCVWHHRVDLHGVFGWSAGFDLLQPSSFIFQRAATVIGVFGFLNLAAGGWLVYRRQVIGWLTVFPVAAFFLPGFSLFLERYFQQRDPLVFHRLFFAIPVGLALVVAAQQLLKNAPAVRFERLLRAGGVGMLLILVVVPSDSNWNNRLWHMLYQVPSDLAATWAQADAPRLEASLLQSRLGYELRGPEPAAYLLNVLGASATRTTPEVDPRRPGTQRPPPAFPGATDGHASVSSIYWYLPDARAFFSPTSQAALLSGHWHPQTATLITAGLAERTEILRQDPVATRRLTLPSGATVFAVPSLRVTQLFPGGLGLEPVSSPLPSALGKNAFRYQRDHPGYIRCVAQGDAPIFSSRAGLYRCRVRFLPARGGADVLLNVVTAAGSDRIYLIHHRKGNRLYYYIGRYEIGPWAVPSTDSSEWELELSWSPGKQALRVNGQIALHSEVTTPDETVTGLYIGKHLGEPERGLEGDLLVEDLRLLALKAH